MISCTDIVYFFWPLETDPNFFVQIWTPQNGSNLPVSFLLSPSGLLQNIG